MGSDFMAGTPKHNHITSKYIYNDITRNKDVKEEERYDIKIIQNFLYMIQCI